MARVDWCFSGISVTYDAVGVLRRGVVGQLERVWQELISVSAAYQ